MGGGRSPQLDPLLHCGFILLCGEGGAFFANWTSTVTRLLEPATSSSKHGYFVNRCYRHHNLDGLEAFTTHIPSEGKNVSVVDAIANWAFGLDGPTTLIDPRSPLKAC